MKSSVILKNKAVLKRNQDRQSAIKILKPKANT